jgi:integrase
MSVYKRKGATEWSYDFYRGGTRFSGTTGTADRRKAEAEERKQIALAEEKIRTEAASRRKTSEPTFDEAARRYWDEVAQHCASPLKAEAELDRLVEAVGETTLLTAITDDFVSKLVLKRRQDFVKGDPKRGRISPSQVNRSTTQLLRRILTRARKVWKQALPEEPNWAAHMLAEPRERVRELRHDEEAKLEEIERDDYRAPRLFAQITGLRRREVANLTWDQVDFANETISVVGKGDKPHVLPLTDELREILEPLRGHHPSAVFTYVAQRSREIPKAGRSVVRGQRYPITYEGFATQMGRAFDSAGLKDFRIHDLRHTAATRTLRATGNLRLVQRLLAHSSPTTTAKYAHATLDDVRAGMALAASDSRRRRSGSHAKSHQTAEAEPTP